MPNPQFFSIFHFWVMWHIYLYHWEYWDTEQGQTGGQILTCKCNTLGQIACKLLGEKLKVTVIPQPHGSTYLPDTRNSQWGRWLDCKFIWNICCRLPSKAFEPRHDKTNKVTVCPVKTQVSLGICPVWSESLLSAWRKLGSLATH